MKEKIFEALNELGVPCHLKGRRYLECAIEKVLEYGEAPFHKVVYPYIAKTFNATRSKVERGIRVSIEKAFTNSEPEIIEKYFGNTVSFDKGKLTNAEFVYGVARYLEVYKGA